MKTNMTKEEFQDWKKSWFDRIPKCEDFACCHELMSCAIRPLCGCGSIYETYLQQKDPEECTTVDCMDCMRKYDCKRPRKLMIDSMNHNDRLMKKLGTMDTSPKYDNISSLLEMKDKKIKQMIKDMESMPAHKCLSPDCPNSTTGIWCEKCLVDLGEYIEQHPISSYKDNLK